MKRVLFIYNRHAGKNKTWAGLSDMINAMTEQHCLVTAYPTQYRGDAGDAIVRWGEDFDRVVEKAADCEELGGNECPSTLERLAELAGSRPAPRPSRSTMPER